MSSRRGSFLGDSNSILSTASTLSKHQEPIASRLDGVDLADSLPCRSLRGEKLGPYEILAPIGAGGMGEVYRAHDTRLRREVAIKVLPETIAQGGAWERFRARGARGLRAESSRTSAQSTTWAKRTAGRSW